MRAPQTGWSVNWRRRMPDSWQPSAKAEGKLTTPRVGTSCYVNVASQNFIKYRSMTNLISLMVNKIFDKDIFSWYCFCLFIAVGIKIFCGPIQEVHVLIKMCFLLYFYRIAETSKREWEKNGRYGQNMGAKTRRSKVDHWVTWFSPFWFDSLLLA